MSLGHPAWHYELVSVRQFTVIRQLASGSAKDVVADSGTKLVDQLLGSLLLKFVGFDQATFDDLLAVVLFEGPELAQEAALYEVQ